MTKVIQFPTTESHASEARRPAPFQDFCRSVLIKLRLPENPRILAFGHNVADAMRALIEHTRGRGEFLVLDSPGGAIRKMRAAQLEVRNWSPDHLPLRSGEFDLVLGARGLMHVENPQPIISEAARVLKPSAQMLLIEADLGGYIATTADGAEPNSLVRLNPYIARELPLLCREAGLKPTDLFPNFVVSPEPVTRELLHQKNSPIRTLRPHVRNIERLDLNEYVRGMERIVQLQTKGHTAALLDVAVLARKV